MCDPQQTTVELPRCRHSELQRLALSAEPQESPQFADLLPSIAHEFATTPPTEAAVSHALARICRLLRIDQCAVLQRTSGGDALVTSQTWASKHIHPAEVLSQIRESRWVAGEVLAGNTIQLPYPANDSRAHACFDTATTGLRILVLPLFHGGAVAGALAFALAGAEQHWAEPLRTQLQTVADLLANVLACIQAEQEVHKLRAEVRRLREANSDESLQVRDQVHIDRQYESIIGKSEAIQQVLSQAEQVASTESIVLLTGETGTGKELVAQLIHDLSPRRAKRIVKVNCAALPPNLVESELFGRERGAYTGAMTREIGRFELADQSTILLDELAELPMELQAKLLRVLQAGEFERVGSPKPIRVNVRVIAATNRDLKRAMREGKFREDLYYRLNVFPIEIPPLRERPEDIPMLVWAFVGEFANAMGKTIEAIPQASMEALQRYGWPGNVRELRNVIERAMIVSGGSTLQVAIPTSPGPVVGKDGPLNLTELERQHILEVLRRTHWRIRGMGGASELLGVKATTLEARMARLGISRNSDKGEP